MVIFVLQPFTYFNNGEPLKTKYQGFTIESYKNNMYDNLLRSIH